jgi:hypothetical protein
MDERRWGINADHAHWLSSVALRDRRTPTRTGVIDVRSHGFGVGDPLVSGVLTDSGASAGVPFSRQGRTWGGAPPQPRDDVLDITATNIGQVTIDATRARVTCNARLNITSDGPLAVHWINCG